MCVLDTTEALHSTDFTTPEVGHLYLCGVEFSVFPTVPAALGHICDRQSFLYPPWQINLEFLLRKNINR